MTDSTAKNASMIAEDTLIKMKHTACGHIANVPNWIVGELAEEDRISSKHGRLLYCNLLINICSNAI